jgi:hypothetical protein
LKKELIPILYTIREADGLQKLLRFLESVKNSDLELFELVFIAKSNNSLFSSTIRNLVTTYELDFTWRVYSTSDAGYYFSSYRRFLLEHHCTQVILLSSDSIINHKDWAKILIWPIETKLASISGSMGSWESILENKTTIRLISVKKYLKCHLSPLEVGLDIYYNGEVYPLSRREHIYRRKIPNKIIHFLSKVLYLKTLRTNYYFKKSFSRFPNPHIRTTGFAITRELFLKTVTCDTESEMAGFIIESGKRSFANLGTSASFQKSAVIWVGNGYVDLTNDSVAITFRSESDFVPLVVDDHYLDYKFSNSQRKSSMRWITWGV